MLLTKDQIPADLIDFFEPAECGRCYVCHLVAVFREVRRVLRDDGTLWLNLGDSYAGSTMGGGPASSSTLVGTHHTERDGARFVGKPRGLDGLKPKDLCGIPWRVAFALQSDGWYLRSEIIWSKPNPMPESVTDRPTKAHEQIFLLAKSERYFYDAEAVKETGAGRLDRGHASLGRIGEPGWKCQPLEEWTGRNRRSVWTVATQPYPEAHFATFPPDLIKPCVMAGCPWGGVVLDPFAGAGTTLYVAKELGRRAIGIELNPAYAALAERRIAQGVLLLTP